MNHSKPFTDEELEELEETLKRCPEGTLEALVDYRNQGTIESLHRFLVGVLKRHVEPEFESLLDGNRSELTFVDDLGIDSMTMMEVVMMVEECLGIQMENEELMEIRTYGNLEQYISAKL